MDDFSTSHWYQTYMMAQNRTTTPLSTVYAVPHDDISMQLHKSNRKECCLIMYCCCRPPQVPWLFKMLKFYEQRGLLLLSGNHGNSIELQNNSSCFKKKEQGRNIENNPSNVKRILVNVCACMQPMLQCIHHPGSKTAVNLDQLKHRSVGARECVCVWLYAPSRVPPSPITWLTQDGRELRERDDRGEKRWEDVAICLLTWDAERAQRGLSERDRKRGNRESDTGKMNGSQWQKDVPETGEAEVREEYWRMAAEVEGGRHCLMQAAELHMTFM